MGKKARKTRWRTLAITSGEQSDSEESNSQSGQQQISKSYPQKPYYSKFPYSSQSTPVRTRFQNDTKSTRSSSTTSENKITFNEDEYTKITTPRQDVLFKKGYLSKPKTYQTQTSTGNSTVSTGNSTGNGTPDHQSADGTEGTDLEYESQFVFPNGYVDPNGIYYINSFEPYPPLVVYNAPYCYPEYPITRSKRYSTDSLTESTSPHNEETSQDQSQSGGETFRVSEQTKPLVNGHHCEDDDVTAQQDSENAEQRKVKKRRRRKLSKPVPDGTSSEDGDELVNRIAEETNAAAKKVELKPDAKEFIPRAYQNVQFIPNFIPLPLISELHPAFLPPGIPINFIPPDKIMHNCVNFIPNYVPKVYETQPEEEEEEAEEEVVPVPKPPEVKEENYKSNIDIEKIVSKLEEAAKEQRFYENRKQKYSPHKFNNSKSFAKKSTRKPEVAEVTKPENCSSAVSKPNYAETLSKKKKIDKPAQSEPVKPKPTTVSPNQWISVSRKKRRYKNTIEEVEVEDVQVCEQEEFEAYDVEKLQDVIMPNAEGNEPVPEIKECTDKIAEEKVEEVEEQKLSECDEIEELIRSLEEIEAKTNLLKRRSKSSKSRRVIITDVDLSQNSRQEEVLRSPVRIIKGNDDEKIAKVANQKDEGYSNNDSDTNKKSSINSRMPTDIKKQIIGEDPNVTTMNIVKTQHEEDNSENSNLYPKVIIIDAKEDVIEETDTRRKSDGIDSKTRKNIKQELVLSTEKVQNEESTNGINEVTTEDSLVKEESEDSSVMLIKKTEVHSTKNQKESDSTRNHLEENPDNLKTTQPEKLECNVTINGIQDNNVFEKNLDTTRKSKDCEETATLSLQKQSKSTKPVKSDNVETSKDDLKTLTNGDDCIKVINGDARNDIFIRSNSDEVRDAERKTVQIKTKGDKSKNTTAINDNRCKNSSSEDARSKTTSVNANGNTQNMSSEVAISNGFDIIETNGFKDNNEMKNVSKSSLVVRRNEAEVNYDEVGIDLLKNDEGNVNFKKSKMIKTPKSEEVFENGTNLINITNLQTPVENGFIDVSEENGSGRKDFERENNTESEKQQEDDFKLLSGQRKQRQQKKSSSKNNQSSQKLASNQENGFPNELKVSNDIKYIKLENELSPNKLVIENSQEVLENGCNEVDENLSNLKVKKSKTIKTLNKNNEVDEDVETPVKKSKKKKKPKATSARKFDEPYDYLLNNTFQENEKTNVEISEELSKMIQRGMYSSLEEKIKSLNITAANDGFFKTITYADTVEKRNDLTNVVNTSNLFKPKRSVEDIDLTKLKLPNLEPGVSGSFLDLSNEQKDPGIAKDSLYPITQAVKDWMTKTRETTPEVEILKSPSTILKEVLQNGDDANNEEEEVIFSKDWSLTPQTSFEEELEWDDEIETKTARVDIAEDVLDVCESKYGKNEDYAKIKAEIEEKKRNGTFPKHGNLPYRAICCSLM